MLHAGADEAEKDRQERVDQAAQQPAQPVPPGRVGVLADGAKPGAPYRWLVIDDRTGPPGTKTQSADGEIVQDIPRLALLSAFHRD